MNMSSCVDVNLQKEWLYAKPSIKIGIRSSRDALCYSLKWLVQAIFAFFVLLNLVETSSCIPKIYQTILTTESLVYLLNIHLILLPQVICCFFYASWDSGNIQKRICIIISTDLASQVQSSFYRRNVVPSIFLQIFS